MDKALRNTLRNVVTQCRKLLEDSIADTLEGQYGVYRSGKSDDDAAMGHLLPDDRAVRTRLLIHLKHIQSGGFKAKDAVEQLTREVAYTHLNRLAAYKMMEKRGLIREAVSRGIRSQGLSFYLADHPDDEALHDAGKQDIAYRHFLTWQGAQFSDEIGVLFSATDLANVLFPPQRVLDEVLARINSEELQDIWAEDEAIGWIYQYFTPKELRDKARAESQAPRNSYELSFRNQFFTPRYVVEFLTDNTLGRIWYEMLQGDTVLTEQCRYLVRRPTEIFLKEGETAPEMIETAHLSQEELLLQPVYIPHRLYKDPRRLRVLDPACGSGHFLLYAFDLLAAIYEEAWERTLRDPVAGSLRDDYPTLDTLRLDVPRLILAHNLHGIDIDARATQIAALALWLRAQRYYQALGLKRGDDRPNITRGNLVCAEPMPGDEGLLDEFSADLQPKVLGQLVRAVFNKMKLAGEAGSLLKIEEELQDAIEAAKKQYVREQAVGPELQTRSLFPDLFPAQATQLSMFDLSDLDDATFFDQAEKRVLDALHEYARHATNGKGLQRRLFADDAARGFAFIDLCRKRYDVVLMNPPFGIASELTKRYFSASYPEWNNNLLCCFIQRTVQLAHNQGSVGAIYDRTAWVKLTYEDFRRKVLLSSGRISVAADLGWEVLDANVEVTCNAFDLSKSDSEGIFFDVRASASEEKARALSEILSLYPRQARNVYISSNQELTRLPNAVLTYDIPMFVKNLFAHTSSFLEHDLESYTGAQIRSEQHFFLYWEVSAREIFRPNNTYCHLYNGGEYSRFYVPPRDVVLFGKNGDKVDQSDSSYTWRLRLGSTGEHYYKRGIGFGVRGDYFDAHLLQDGHLFTVEGQSMPIEDENEIWLMLGLLNSTVFQIIINSYCGQHKYSGYINSLPYPEISHATKSEIITRVKHQYEMMEKWYSFDSTTLVFIANRLGTLREARSLKQSLHVVRTQNIARYNSIVEEYKELNRIIEYACAVENENELQKVRDIEQRILTGGLPFLLFDDYDYVAELLDYIFGVVQGVWNIDAVLHNQNYKYNALSLSLLPTSPPGMLQGDDGLPLTQSPPGYPVDIQWDGILVDDEDHAADVVGRTRQVIDLLWGERADAIEREACEILGVKSLRDYFRKSGKGGFWDDHVKRYSKSRRQAPIYWLLQSSKKNYGLWLYYHRLDKDILYKALVNYVEPKIRLEESRLNDLRAQLVAAGNVGMAAKKLAGEVEKQEALLVELDEFHDKLERAANLNLTPDLNDGVVLNIAPLRELVPWKVAKAYWDELMQGKYEWSTISGQLREKGLI